MSSDSDAEGEAGLLGLVSAAVAGEASFLEIQDGKNETAIRFDGRVFTGEELEELVSDQNSDPDLEPMIDGLKPILASNVPRLQFESWDGETGFRLKVSEGAGKLENIARSPWKGGDPGNRVRVQYHVGIHRNIGFGTTELRAGVQQVKERCVYSGIRIEVNGESINQAVDLGKCMLWVFLSSDEQTRATRLNPRTPESQLEHRDHASGLFSAVLGLGAERENLHVVVRGVTYPIEIPVLEELGFAGVVACADLTVKDDKVVEDDVFDSFLSGLEDDVIGCTDVLFDNLEKLDEEQRERVLEAIEYLVDLSRESEDFEETEKLLRKLLKAQRAAGDTPDEEVAQTLTYLAQTLGALSRWEHSRSLFEEALELWNDCDEPEERLLADCLAHLARMDFEAENHAEAEKKAARALEIRRETHEPEELELGQSQALLGRIYALNYNYPSKPFLEAERLFRQALEVYEKNFGQHHSDIAAILTELGEYYRGQRRYDEAEPNYLRSLAVREKLFGSYNPEVGETLDSLGALYEDLGQSTKAGHYHKKALEVWERILGPDHPDVAARLDNLVVLYRLYGEYGEAEPLYERILEIREQSLGQNDPQLVADLSSLGLLYQVQGKFPQADKYLSRGREILQQALGDEEDDADMAWLLNLLGCLYVERYHFKDAEKALTRALAAWERILGPEHPDVASSLEFLIRHLRTQQKYAEAIPLAQRVLSIQEEFFGPVHTTTATTLNTLAELMRLAGQESESRTYYQAAYEIWKRANPIPIDPEKIENVEDSRYTVARLEAEALHQSAAEPAREFRRYMEAEHLYLKALFAREQVLGPGHPDNAWTLDLLADLYRNHRKFEGAQLLHERALKLRKKSLGREHPDVCISLRDLSKTLLLQEKFDEAAPHIEEWLTISERNLGADHPDVADALYLKSRVLESQTKEKETADVLQRAVTIRKAALGVENPEFATALAELLRIQGNNEESAKLYGFVVSSLENSLDPEAPELIPILENFAVVLSRTGEEDESAAMETRAMVLRVGHGLDFG